MRRRCLVGVALLGLVVAGCGGDDDAESSPADPALVELLQDEAGQTEAIATCIAEKLDGNDEVDREQLESIIRGEGTEDIDTADAYGDAALTCAEELVGDIPGAPDDLDLSS